MDNFNSIFLPHNTMLLSTGHFSLPAKAFDEVLGITSGITDWFCLDFITNLLLQSCLALPNLTENGRTTV
jgi:hypothetical protein